MHDLSRLIVQPWLAGWLAGCRAMQAGLPAWHGNIIIVIYDWYCTYVRRFVCVCKYVCKASKRRRTWYVLELTCKACYCFNSKYQQQQQQQQLLHSHSCCSKPTIVSFAICVASLFCFFALDLTGL